MLPPHITARMLPAREFSVKQFGQFCSFFFAMHIHEYGDCTPPFDKTGMHYNPGDTLHPQHAGDLVPLLANHSYAWCVFYDERFSLPEVIGKSVIIHRSPDDFLTQPSGNSGDKIATGEVLLSADC